MTDPPERLDRFMARANTIYYSSHDPFADFTTAPEVSQVFGEIIGLWAAVTWEMLGSPDPVLLVEAGPGRGTLMADALRAVRRASPAFAAAVAVHLIETSARLRTAQAARITGARWHHGLATVPRAPMILLANEFLDALPIRQFVRRGDTWTECFVAQAPDGGRHWLEIAADPTPVPSGRDVANGGVIEVNEPARAFVAELGDRFREHPGAALFLDYGPTGGASGMSLQALAGKRPVDPLSLPGSADLTAHVDFADLAGVALDRGAVVLGPRRQGPFLTDLGLFQRTERLARNRPEAEAADLLQAARRLADPSAMGELFKVMAVCSAGCPPLAGFSPADL